MTDGPIGPTAATRHFDTETEQGLGKYLFLWRTAPSGFLFLNACVEQLPNENNTVTTGSAKTQFGTPKPIISYNYDNKSKERVHALSKQFESLAERIGLNISNRRTYEHAHPMCTSRMTENPRDGVVDPDLRIHNTDNLYVCGSACFTTGGAANPTLTIAALAHRLGTHLTKKS
jgi:choline dehydrogenase-like flavoprotein